MIQVIGAIVGATETPKQQVAAHYRKTATPALGLVGNRKQMSPTRNIEQIAKSVRIDHQFEKIVLRKRPDLRQVVGRNTLGNHLPPLLSEKVGLVQLQPPEISRFLCAPPRSAEAAPKNCEKNEHFRQSWIKFDFTVRISVRMLEERCMLFEALNKFAAVFVLDPVGIKQQIATVRVALFAERVDDLVTRTRQRVHRNRVAASEPEADCCSQLATRRGQLADVDNRVFGQL